MPEPGPAYFDARRALWKTANPHPTPKAPEFPDSTATSRRRLDTLLADPTIDLESDQVWYGQGSLGGLDKVWKSLSNGSRLKRRLPLPSLIRLLRVGWVRDGTWPKGGVAPDSDDDFLGGVTTQVPSAATSQYPSAISTPVGERPEYLVSHRQVRSVFGK
ncbi:hypothetical protein K474DRAFT_1655248 [Panus rudis PR-1116 ss-1]|nr:hypothetical protein K474DRAFT_1655248 [Panus rudis PR-1116 ss-1]